ncbi:MAG: hypothetical protein HKM04_01355 [Legionellales bacterium]|nr:hypothetical protein [Legionellales bacterium]
MKTTVSLGESYAGSEHFKLGFDDLDGPIKLEIQSKDPAEVKVLREHLFLENGNPIEFEGNQAIIPANSNVYFDGRLIAKCDEEPAKFYQLPLPAIRAIAEYNDTKTNNKGEFYQKLSERPSKETYKRIDGHTHFVAAFSMKSALEKAIKLNDIVHMPVLVILKILKDKGMLNDSNRGDWINFLNNNLVISNNENFKQKDASGDLIKEDFLLEIPQMDEQEKEVSIKNNRACYVDIQKLMDKLGPEAWGEFCNGFDLAATHFCDFTEHMEMAYNLRNWFGKDTTFLKAQMLAMHEAYEIQGIDYAEIPAGFFKKQEDLDKFIALTQEIEAQREIEGKKPIILRPGLSIARLLEPTLFRKVLFSYIPMILRNPELASITVLAHETNPTTEHLIAIRDFAQVINEIRPGFTIEVHAGETATYGEVNMSEARSLAHRNKRTVIRAGHASYGDHTSDALDNFFEEKCPLSNLTLIDLEPEVHVNVLLGIAEGKTNMFWGSDGSIYNPLYSPAKQEAFFMELMAHPDIEQELKLRWDEDRITNRFDAKDFESYKKSLASELNNQLERNQKNEDNYINFKQCEKAFHKMKMNIDMLSQIEIKLTSDPRSDHTNEITAIQTMLKEMRSLSQAAMKSTSFSEFQQILMDNHAKYLGLNGQSNEIIEQFSAQYPKLINKNQLVQALTLDSRSKQQEGRSAIEFYYKVCKLVPVDYAILMSNPALKNRLSNLEKRLGSAVFKDVLDHLKTNWNVQGPLLYPSNAFLSENDNKAIERFYELILGMKSGIENMYKSLNACIISPNAPLQLQKQLFTNEEVDKLRRFLISNYEDVHTVVVIDALPTPNRPPIEKFELYLDPAYNHNKVANAHHKRSSEELKIHQLEPISLSKNALVLFGSPELCSDEQKQKDYMANLYDTIYTQLLAHKEDGVVLLGNVYEGINPLVYKVLDDFPDTFRGMPVYSIVTPDENINNLRRGTDTVPYLIEGKSRQEAHIAYADFIQKNQLSNVIMLGGKSAIWSDTKNALAERKLNNNELLGHKIQFYDDGFGSARSSSAYAKGAPKQACKHHHHHQKPIASPVVQSSLLEPKYYEQNPKTASYHKNLVYAFQAIMILFKAKNIPTTGLSLEHFLVAYNPTLSQQHKDHSVITQDEGQEVVEKFFTDFLQSEYASPSVLKNLGKILSEGSGYGIANDMDRHFPDFSLSNQIQSTLEERQHRAGVNIRNT